MKRTIVFLTSTPLLLGACGLLFTQGPPSEHEKMLTPFKCTESMMGPTLDVVLGVVGIWFLREVEMDTDASLSSTTQTYWSVALGGVTGASAIVGFDRVTKCREARRDLTLRQAEAAAALATRRRSADLIAVQKVLITDGRDTTTVGTWTQLVAKAYDSTGAVILDKSFAWSSSNDTIASVSAAGLVRARRVGTAVITANAGNAVGTANVVVVPAR